MNKNKQVAMVVMAVLLAGLGWGAWQVDASAVEATAGTIPVNTLDDELNTDGDCSLREAIEAANTNAAVDGCAAGEAIAVDTITFAVEGTITVAEQLVVTAGGPLVVDGGNEITISGGNETRVIYVDYNSTLTLQRLTIADGYTKGEHGAGLYGSGANITILECQFLHNRMGMASRGGGIYSQDGILTVVDSLFEGNGSSEQDTNGGGGFVNEGEAEFIRTTFRNNESGGYLVRNCFYICMWEFYPGGGGLFIAASGVIRESSFIANTGGLGGGGILNKGETTILNSTFSNNLAEGGSEYSNGGGGILNQGTLTIINSTLSENHSLRVNGGGLTGNAYVANSIIANNTPDDCADSISDGGHNISSDGSCGYSIANGSLPYTDPLLGPLQDNGGATMTYALLDGSPAIDAGSPTDCPATDQRGAPRPIDGDDDGDAVCDIGAYEYQLEGTFIAITSDDPDPSVIGELFTVNFAVISSLGTPTGEVTVTVGDNPASCSASLVDGQGSCELTLNEPGDYILTATYAGSGIFIPSSDSDWHTVVPYTVLTITGDSPDPSLSGQPFLVTFRVTSILGIPDGEVTVTISGRTTNCFVTLVDGQGSCLLTIDTPGEYLLTATYPGSGDFEPCSDTEQHQVNGFMIMRLPMMIKADY